MDEPQGTPMIALEDVRWERGESLEQFAHFLGVWIDPQLGLHAFSHRTPDHVKAQIAERLDAPVDAIWDFVPPAPQDKRGRRYQIFRPVFGDHVSTEVASRRIAIIRRPPRSWRRRDHALTRITWRLSPRPYRGW
jgi:hypothetical protein